MKLLIFARRYARREGLHALSVPRSDEATDVQRRPNAAHLVLETASKGANQRSNFASQRSFVADTRAVTLTYEALR